MSRKEVLLQKILGQYDDLSLWNNVYFDNGPPTESEKKHLQDVMRRDQALKKKDSDRIYEMCGTFPTLLRPELLQNTLNQLRNKSPAIPGSGLVSFCAPVFNEAKRASLRQSLGRDGVTDIAEMGRKRSIVGEFFQNEVNSKFSKRCPICMHAFSPLLVKLFCIQCGIQMCQRCSRHTSGPDPVVVCQNCFEVAKIYCKTGDWFTQFIDTKKPSPLRLNLDMTAISSKKPSMEKCSLSVSPTQTQQHQPSSPGFQRQRTTLTSGPISEREPPLQPKSMTFQHAAPTPILEGSDDSDVDHQLTNAVVRYNAKSTNGTSPNGSNDLRDNNHSSSPRIRRTYLSQSSELQRLSSVSPNEKSSSNRNSHRDSDFEQSEAYQHLVQTMITNVENVLNKDKNRSQRKSEKRDSHGSDTVIESAVQGEVEFTIDYDQNESQLAVLIWSVRNLSTDIHKHRQGNLYAKVHLLPKLSKTDTLKIQGKLHGNEAQFKQSVCFFITPRDLNQRSVKIELWCKRGIHSKLFLGEAEVVLSCSEVKDKNHRILALTEKRKERLTIVAPPSSGTVELALRFQVNDNQKMLIQLQENAHFIGTLEVWIKNAHNLCADRPGDEINACLKVQLLGGQTVPEPQCTDSIPRTYHPEWNSVLRFINIRISDLREQYLKLTVLQNSHFRQEEIGYLKIGPSHLIKYSGEESDLWVSLLIKPFQWNQKTLAIRKPQHY